MNSGLKYIIVFLISAVLINSCAYNKIKKDGTSDQKYDLAVDLFNKEKYAKAMPLLEEIIPVFKGTEKGEDVYYKFAICNYKLQDYILAGYYYRKFAETYPSGKNTEEARWMSAYCYFLDAPKSSLDQTTTNQALDEFRFFLSKYPKSSKIPECNEIVAKLRDRLETKSYDNSILYYNLEYYKSASIALKNSKSDYPDTDYKELIFYYIMKSDLLYAQNSISEKQFERYTKAEKSANEFIEKFPNSEYINDAKKISEKIQKEKQNLENSLSNKTE